jgi:PAS domain S-box-containing protein
MTSDDILLNPSGQEPETDLNSLLQKLLLVLSGGKGSSGTQSIPPEAALLGDLRQALDRLQGQLQNLPAEEEEAEELPAAVAPAGDPLAAVFEGLPVPVAVLDAQGSFQRANPSLVAALGFDPTGLPLAELISRISLCLTDGSLFSLETSSISRALQGEKVPGDPVHYTNQAGELFDAILTSSPLFSGQEVSGAVLFWQPANRGAAGNGDHQADTEHKPSPKFPDLPDMMKSILEYLPVGLVIADGKEGKVRLISESGKSSLPSGFPEVEGSSWEDILSRMEAFHPDGERRATLEELPPRRILEAGERVEDEEWIFQQEDGQRTHIIFSGGPLRSPTGEITGGVLAWQDVTDHRRSEALIRDSEARERARAAELEAVLDAVPATVWIAKDPECREVTGNRYSYEMLRMAPGANQSKTAPEGQEPSHFRVFHEGVEMAPEELPLQVSAAQGIEIRGFEEDIVFDDGQVSHVLGNVTPLLDEQNRPRGAVAAFVDITARVQVEQALRESEKRYRTLFESLSEGFSLLELVYDEAGKPVDIRLLEVNPAFERITGVSREQVIGKTRQELQAIAPPELVELVARVVQAEGAVQFEYYSETLGKYLDISAYRTGENQLALLSVDITERKKAEKALRQAHEELEDRVKERARELLEAIRLLSERNEQLRVEIDERLRAEAALQASTTLFERLFQSAPDPIFLLDEGDRIQNLNLQAISTFGYGVEELVGQPFEVLLPGYLQVHFASWRSEEVDDQGPRPVLLDLDLFAQRKDGWHIPVDITLSPIQLKDDRKSICIVHDITLRKGIEDALRQSEASFRAIFEQSPVGIHLLDLNGSNLRWNPCFQQLVGYEEAELREMTYLDYTDPEDIEKARQHFEALIKGEIDHYNLEKRILRKDGGVRWGRLSVTLARDEEEMPLFIVKIVEDIDERKRVEAELKEVQRRLIDSAESERILIARELHDGPMQEIFALNYALASVSGSLADSEQVAELRTIQVKLIEINQVLREVMRELRPPTLAPFGLEKAILDHAERFDQKYPELNVRLDLMPDGSSLPERVRLALFRIYQAAVSNVARHARASQLEVRLRLSEKEAILEILDDGVGFEVPERWIGLVRQGQYGLVGAAERAEAIGGRLLVSSRPGGGTSVKVSVPIGIDL